MKLLVSDYDNTIEISSFLGNSYIPKNTNFNIKNFINSGNKFMISTARPYDSIIEEVRRYHIPYNYISVLNGTIIYDKNGVIYSKDMPYLDIDNFYKLYSCIKKIKLVKNNDKLLYYVFMTKFLINSKELINDLKDYNLDIQRWFFDTYNIVHPISNKVDGVRYIQDLYNISDDEVIVVGDADDDLEMIKNYYSYGIVSYLPNFEVLRNCDVKVKSLNSAFKYINKNI